LTFAASGVVSVVSAVSGDPSWLGPIHVWDVSGTAGATSGTAGHSERVTVLGVSGTVTVQAWLKLDVTRVPLVLGAAGTVAVVSGVSGAGAKLGLIWPAAGIVIVISSAEADGHLSLPSYGSWGLPRIGV